VILAVANAPARIKLAWTMEPTFAECKAFCTSPVSSPAYLQLDEDIAEQHARLVRWPGGFNMYNEKSCTVL